MDNKITAGTLAANMALATGKSRKLCEDFIREFFKLAAENLETGESLKIKGFGSFKIIDVERRESVNVSTGERHEIPPYRKVVFTPSKEMAETINAPFCEFDSVEIDDEIPDEILSDNVEPEEVALPNENPATSEETPLMEDETVSDEDAVSQYRLEEGSDEEGADDEITAEAYLYDSSKPDNQPHVESPALANSEDEEFYDQEPEPSRFWNGFLIGTLSTFAVCAVIFMIGCFLDWWPLNFGDARENTEIVEETGNTTNPEDVVTDIPEEETQAPEPIYDTVSTTRYLTTIAREHYGDFNFWPYIYEENQSILGHPDRITPGTKVVVPPLSKYGVDPANPDDVKEAKRKGAEIYARFTK